MNRPIPRDGAPAPDGYHYVAVPASRDWRVALEGKRCRGGAATVPSNERPYRLASAEGDELHIVAAGRSMTFRQIGWHGQTGAFYSLDEDPSLHEPGSFGPLWILAHNDAVVEPEDQPS